MRTVGPPGSTIRMKKKQLHFSGEAFQNILAELLVPAVLLISLNS